ncbi:citrate lyase subunit beta / citryl-CoA lyase [Pollutimonas bauzanensis]|uniref:Citrate lyase subunit beta / citryl-CoA lyase n=2 Tax=Pollutimonas bauzanensis TaxID=658167 RepID=A0A1M5ZTG8_9BURK|nr:citrate lyase subunit beta / citryl-CoA lyase [Pollutimonas bauzanensis]
MPFKQASVPMSDINLWRSILFVPAVNDRYVESAMRRPADVLQIDLEDSVAPDDKALARGRVRGIARKFAAAGYDVTVRINRPWRMALPDIEQSVGADVAALTLPKVPDAAYVRYIGEILDECEAEQGLAIGHTRLIAMVEDAEGLANMAQIAAAGPRVCAMIVGAEDLAANMRMAVSEDTLYIPNAMAVASCRRAGIVPIGFVGSVADFNDADEFRRKITRARGLGFDAAFCIHPRQVEIVNEEFSPKLADVENARLLIAEFEKQKALGKAACTYNGRMVDLPVVLQARQLVERYAAYQQRPGSR